MTFLRARRSILLFNPYHDRLGRFASKGSATGRLGTSEDVVDKHNLATMGKGGEDLLHGALASWEEQRRRARMLMGEKFNTAQRRFNNQSIGDVINEQFCLMGNLIERLPIMHKILSFEAEGLSERRFPTFAATSKKTGEVEAIAAAEELGDTLYVGILSSAPKNIREVHKAIGGEFVPGAALSLLKDMVKIADERGLSISGVPSITAGSFYHILAARAGIDSSVLDSGCISALDIKKIAGGLDRIGVEEEPPIIFGGES